MSQQRAGIIGQNARSNWILLRTLVLVRWIAMAGQIVTIAVAAFVFDLQMPLVLCAIVIGALAILNIYSSWQSAQSRRLTESETVVALCYDTLQLCMMIALTGGLNNPFALLVLAPVTVAATVLPTQQTAIVGAVAIVFVSLTGPFHFDLIAQDGNILEMPGVFAFGFWVAIITGVVFIALYARRVTTELNSMSDALLATQMALAREQKLTDLGGVVAATAHELGTPLATIKLVSSELMEELDKNSDMWEDAELIREQADRCSRILKSMGRAGKDDTHLKTVAFETIVHESAEPHLDRGKTVDIVIIAEKLALNDPPLVLRKPEIIHGLRNLIQNAVDFSQSGVSVEIGWDTDKIFVDIMDDGPGYQPDIIPRLGDPFLRRRKRGGDPQRPEYDGMGLGLFIAKTLLERSGATLRFTNRPSGGACVTVTWPSAATKTAQLKPGANPLFASS